MKITILCKSGYDGITASTAVTDITHAIDMRNVRYSTQGMNTWGGGDVTVTIWGNTRTSIDDVRKYVGSPFRKYKLVSVEA